VFLKLQVFFETREIKMLKSFKSVSFDLRLLSPLKLAMGCLLAMLVVVHGYAAETPGQKGAGGVPQGEQINPVGAKQSSEDPTGKLSQEQQNAKLKMERQTKGAASLDTTGKLSQEQRNANLKMQMQTKGGSLQSTPPQPQMQMQQTQQGTVAGTGMRSR
jgi:hypothetical protein